ncbi:MAG: ATP-binding cassette domain-containing protein [Deltaproteobacteria bacterium]|nr:ATP-binding cassette domain-containing protein [Deltaproteobacteria bacterium]
MVRFFHVARAYGGVEVLSDVTLSLDGEAVVVTGPSGAGKTVLMRLLCGLEAPTRGWITVDGVPLAGSTSEVLAAHRRRLAVVPQEPCLVSKSTVIQNVALALQVQGVGHGEAHERSGAVLARLEIAALADRRADLLSATERRCVALARALVRESASLVLADEPGAGLDPASQRRVGEMLAERVAAGATVVVTSQQPGFPGLEAPRIAFLAEGRITWDSASAASAARAS